MMVGTECPISKHDSAISQAHPAHDHEALPDCSPKSGLMPSASVCSPPFGVSFFVADNCYLADRVRFCHGSRHP